MKNRIIIITAISILLLALTGCSANKNASESFSWGATKKEIQEQCKNDSFFGEDPFSSSLSYKQTNVEFFKNDTVTVLYYFNGNGNGLSKVIYDVSNCNQNNIDKYIDHLRKTCKEIEYGEDKIGNTTYLTGKWEINDTSIKYEKLSSSWIKFYFEPIK